MGLAWLPNYRLTRAKQQKHELRLLIVGQENSGRHSLFQTLFLLSECRQERDEAGKEWLVGSRVEGGVELTVKALIAEPNEVLTGSFNVCLWLNPLPSQAELIKSLAIPVIPLIGKCDCLLPSELERRKVQVRKWLKPSLSTWKRSDDQPWFTDELNSIEEKLPLAVMSGVPLERSYLTGTKRSVWSQGDLLALQQLLVAKFYLRLLSQQHQEQEGEEPEPNYVLEAVGVESEVEAEQEPVGTLESIMEEAISV